MLISDGVREILVEEITIILCAGSKKTLGRGQQRRGAQDVIVTTAIECGGAKNLCRMKQRP